ncbi:hypothetical protein AQUCO_02700374v1 [Aquilegia coerulea]|uniref:Protein kinase domain-containing protein n=1 Tax=Aquilegia coerulea TaxID=218851 RepID=A0A2G5D6L9_AQUCA|nr:hypothetical protein AQUCO_02700374v1 [Aquilegia coerulea]
MGRSFNLKSFRFTTLKDATRNFRPGRIDESSCGMVFKGWIDDSSCGMMFKGWIDEQTLTASKPGMGIPIAVKFVNQEGFQHYKKWLEKVHYSIGNLSHPNLVRLLGYCLHDDLRLLVYEFMPLRSLNKYLFERCWDYDYQISWGIRMKIALGAAKALAFLHSADIIGIHWGCQNSNILVDSNYNAKLMDFGLAWDVRTGDMSNRVISGTYGYACPEYYVGTGMLTAKSDVYSFGVVLLEILSGRRAIDVNMPCNQQNLVEWAMPYLRNKRRIFRVVDSRLDCQYSLGSAQKAAHLAVQCLANEAKLRPNMDVVVTALEQLQEESHMNT